MPAMQLVTSIAELTINSLLKTQPTAHAILRELDDKRLIVFLDVFPQGLTLSFSDKVTVVYESQSFEEAKALIDSNTCIVKTKISVLPELANTSQLTALIQRGDLDLIGDLAIAQKASSVLSNGAIDLEELFAQKTSDVFAHTTFSLARSMSSRFSRMMSSLSFQGAELMLEERPIAARQQAVAAFADDVSKMRDDVERFAAKIDAYEKSVLVNKADS